MDQLDGFDIWNMSYDIMTWQIDKQSLLRLHMKTKVVQHVPRINIKHLTSCHHNMTAWQTITFELTHENKSCSACPKDQQYAFDIWHVTCIMWHPECDMWHNYKYSLLSIDKNENKNCSAYPKDHYINISISHITCDMWKVKCDKWHVT